MYLADSEVVLGAVACDHRDMETGTIALITLITGLITALVSLVSAVGVLVVNSKVDRLTGRVDALESALHVVLAAVMGRKLPVSGGDSS